MHLSLASFQLLASSSKSLLKYKHLSRIFLQPSGHGNGGPDVVTGVGVAHCKGPTHPEQQPS